MDNDKVNVLRYPEDLQEVASVLSFLPEDVRAVIIRTFFNQSSFGLF